MTVEFVHNPGTRRPGTTSPTGNPFSAGIDWEWHDRYVRTIDDLGFDFALVPYASASADQFVLAAETLKITRNLKTVVAVRPNTSFPTVAAQALATLDQLSGGRTIVHIISGGSDEEQRRQGDYLDKEQRYRRSAEFVEVLRKVWTEQSPFDHEGEFYRFEGFGPGYRTASGGAIPVSLGGSSEYAYATGGQQADIFALWGEPLAETQQQIDAVYEEARKAGRTDRIRFWVTFRPVIAATQALAEAKAEQIVEQSAAFSAKLRESGIGRGFNATNVGTTRLQDIAKIRERHDNGALWTPQPIAGNGGASSLLVGTPDTIIEALLEYVKLGADVISLPTLGDLDGAIDTARYILPTLREEIARQGIDPELTFQSAAVAA